MNLLEQLAKHYNPDAWVEHPCTCGQCGILYARLRVDAKAWVRKALVQGGRSEWEALLNEVRTESDMWTPFTKEVPPRIDNVDLWGEAVGLMMPDDRFPRCGWRNPTMKRNGLLVPRGLGWYDQNEQRIQPTHWMIVDAPK